MNNELKEIEEGKKAVAIFMGYTYEDGIFHYYVDKPDGWPTQIIPKKLKYHSSWD